MLKQIETAVERAPVGEWGMQTSTALHDAVLQGGEPARAVADALHGTWLGHPLHPLLTEITVGAWTLGGVFDAVAELTGSERAAWTGDRLAEIGVAAALPTALSGLTDFSAISKGAVKPASLHALMNVVGVGLYTASIVERHRGRARQGRMLGWAALTVAGASAWIGGMLVYKYRVGVDHGDRFDGPDDWLDVFDASELREGQPTRVEVENAGVLLYREGDRIFAVGSVCSHAGGPLEEGRFHDGCVQCPWHDSVFRLDDGSVVHGPATRPQQSFQVRVRKGRIELRRADSPKAQSSPRGRAVKASSS